MKANRFIDFLPDLNSAPEGVHCRAGRLAVPQGRHGRRLPVDRRRQRWQGGTEEPPPLEEQNSHHSTDKASHVALSQRPGRGTDG